MLLNFTGPFLRFIKNKYGDDVDLKKLRNIIYHGVGFDIVEQERYSGSAYRCYHLEVGGSILWPKRQPSGNMTAAPRILTEKKERVKYLGWEFDLDHYDAEHWIVTRYK